MNTTVAALQKKCGIANPDGDFGPATYKAAKNYFNLTALRASHFFGQCEEETGGFNLFEENLHYSPARLLQVFPSHFANLAAATAANTPEKVANIVYANRMGNGNEASGDGWKFRGRGAIQLTGRTNYTELAHHLDDPDILNNPDVVATDYAFEAAIWYFTANNLWKYCDEGVSQSVVTTLTQKVNGGTLGLSARLADTIKWFALK
jgi:putative chitinase